MDEVTTTSQGGEGWPHEVKLGLTSVIIPIYVFDYSIQHYTGHAIGSVREHTDANMTPYEIVVVDNASPISLGDPHLYKADKYVKNETNVGVTKAWNQGIRISQGEYICLLNNDAMVFDHWLEDFQEAAQHLDLVMSTPMYGDPFARAVESGKLRSHWLASPIEHSFSDFRDWACIFTKRELFSELGLFDEIFVNYAQDTDFLKRMELAGKKFASCKRIPIFHIIGATSTSLPETPQVMNEDKERYANKYASKAESEWVHPNPSPAAQDVPVPEPVEYTLDNLPRAIRTLQTGDKAFLVTGKTAQWITTPKVLESLGLKFSDIVAVPYELYNQLEKGPDICE